MWFYLDPQMRVQGPFEGSEMRQWFEAGYFQVGTAYVYVGLRRDVGRGCLGGNERDIFTEIKCLIVCLSLALFFLIVV